MRACPASSALADASLACAFRVQLIKDWVTSRGAADNETMTQRAPLTINSPPYAETFFEGLGRNRQPAHSRGARHDLHRLSLAYLPSDFLTKTTRQTLLICMPSLLINSIESENWPFPLLFPTTLIKAALFGSSVKKIMPIVWTTFAGIINSPRVSRCNSPTPALK